MSDIVERLRMRPDSDCRDGADEIERLRAREAELVALLQRALKLAQLWNDVNAALAKVEEK